MTQSKTAPQDASQTLKQHSWAIALSEEVSTQQPLSVDCGDERIVLWRDKHQRVRALENRCPHRRVELSRGCILPEGTIRCGYHGWTWDGETGKLMNIPNLKGQAGFSAQYRVKTYPVWETDGFVRLSFPEAPENKNIAPEPSRLPAFGSIAVPLDYEQYMAGFFDGPWLFMTIPGVRFTEYFRGDLREENGLLVLERYCNWAGRRADTRFTSDFPLLLRSETNPLAGETALQLSDGSLRVYFTAHMAAVAADRGTTFVRWRASLPAGLGIRRWWLSRREPIRFNSVIDGLALRNLLRSPSIHWQRLRSQLCEEQVIALPKEEAGHVA